MAEPIPETPPTLAVQLHRCALSEVTSVVAGVPAQTVADALRQVPPHRALALLDALEAGCRAAVLTAAPLSWVQQMEVNAAAPAESIGRLMHPPVALFQAQATVAEVIAVLRRLVQTNMVTYCYVVDGSGRLTGVVAMRELLLATPDTKLGAIMLTNPFALPVDMPLNQAMGEVVHRHYPVYPAVDETGRLVGLVRGETMFAERVLEVSAQPGSMVGVEREEHLHTTWTRSLRSRHPWLQINLLTAFLAAAVVATFQDTIDRLVILALFLPVLAGQSGNTGCQALAVTLRGLTLGEFRAGGVRQLLAKEAWMGLVNGALVGITAGLGMYLVASAQAAAAPFLLALVVFLAMCASCVVSGLSGAVIPLALRRLGADPATASSIFLTTATDVASMGLLLGLATVLV